MQLSKNTADPRHPGDATPGLKVRQIHFASGAPAGARLKVVGVTGVEPVTLRLSSACSNQLSYTPFLKNLEFEISNLGVGGAEETRTPDL